MKTFEILKNFLRRLFKNFMRSKGFRISNYTTVDFTPRLLILYETYKYFFDITKDIEGGIADIGFGYGHSASLLS